MNSSTEYPVGFYFSLSFEGKDIAFKEVSGISQELNVEEEARGNENRFKYKVPQAIKSENLILKRAIVPTDSKLIKWCHDTLNGALDQSIQVKNLTVNLMDSKGKTLMSWVFYNTYPLKYSVSDLKFQNNELLIETLEFAYSYFDTKSSI